MFSGTCVIFFQLIQHIWYCCFYKVRVPCTEIRSSKDLHSLAKLRQEMRHN